jgi:hypothetical protein
MDCVGSVFPSVPTIGGWDIEKPGTVTGPIDITSLVLIMKAVNQLATWSNPRLSFPAVGGAFSVVAQLGRMLMRGHTRLFRSTLSLWVALVILTPSLPVSGAVQEKPDSSLQCLDGGWQSLAPQEEPSTPFADQDECETYAEQGGEHGDGKARL